ncbi:hypothetical protein CRUP_020230 [Coryphaenoides rupestris]|nr:hypothetical protein CRUP_020230 [Coryphaenoides rupestris]
MSCVLLAKAITASPTMLEASPATATQESARQSCRSLRPSRLLRVEVVDGPVVAGAPPQRNVRDLLSLVSATYEKQPARTELKSPERPLRSLPSRSTTAACRARPRQGTMSTGLRPAWSLHEPSRVTVTTPSAKPPRSSLMRSHRYCVDRGAWSAIENMARNNTGSTDRPKGHAKGGRVGPPCAFTSTSRKYLLIVLIPLVFLPLPLAISGPEAKCGYAIILMALYSCTECLPLAVIALLPAILFPMMDIMTSSEVCMQYLKDTNMLFIGGLLVAIAVEHWNLHKRIALRVLLLVDLQPALLTASFMGITAFLSMWISNTAATAMMLPIAHATLATRSAGRTGGIGPRRDRRTRPSSDDDNDDDTVPENHGHKKLKSKEKDIATEADVEKQNVEQRRVRQEQTLLDLSKCMNLSVCYAASIGGTATLTGTLPNVILKGQLDDLKSLGDGGKGSVSCGQEAHRVMEAEYRRLGSMSFAECSVLTISLLLLLLWFTREPGITAGWATVLFNQEKTYVTDATVAIFMSSLFFCIPSELPRFSGKDGDGKPFKAPPALLSWDTVHEKMPWSVILLLGGGFALARGMGSRGDWTVCLCPCGQTSGLSVWLGEQLAPLQSIPPFAISILLCLLVAVFTECVSNTATATLFIPILASTASTISLHPLYILLPCTISASLAFMLPMATPPNAIAFSYGNLRVMDMAKSGFILNCIGILTTNLAINTWGTAMFNLSTFPQWANVTILHP